MAPQRTEELQEKRGRGQVACAECRRFDNFFYTVKFLFMAFLRLKVRCDKKIPCGSCVKRGCAAICPTRECAHPWNTVY